MSEVIGLIVESTKYSFLLLPPVKLILSEKIIFLLLYNFTTALMSFLDESSIVKLFETPAYIVFLYSGVILVIILLYDFSTFNS